eukprot:7286992-Pyramimonas_sp.AAC.1
MKASMRAHFHEQITQVPRPDSAMQWYELSTGAPGQGMRSYQWRLCRFESLMMRDREKCAISVHESTHQS